VGNFGACSSQPSGATLNTGGYDSYSRISPVREDLELMSVAHDWIPGDIRTQNKLFRMIYLTDPVAGPALDYYREIPFGPIILGGIKDEKRLQFFNDALEAINISRFLPYLAGDVLTVGRVITHNIMNESTGMWEDMIVHNSDWISVQPQPVLGEDPLLDLIVPPEYKQWATNRDPRVVESRNKLDPKLIRLMAAGGTIPLSPENTIFVARKASASDALGTSLYFRILPLLAIEIAYINAEVLGLRRRAGPILYATAGIDNVWEPGPEELGEILDNLIASEEDPIAAKMAFRNGVELNTVSGFGEIAKYGEQFEWLKNAKLQGLGMNEAFATGDSSWNYLESMLSLGMERIRNFRNFMANEVVLNGLLAPLARYNGFHRRSKAEISHRVRTSSRSEQNLDLPSIEWQRTLRPTADREFLDILQMMKEQGVPITLRQWAQAGGHNIDETLEGLESDIELRKRIKPYQDKIKKLTPSDEDEFGGGGRFGAAVIDEIVTSPVWDRQGEFGQLRRAEVIRVLHQELKTRNPDSLVSGNNWRRFENRLHRQYGLNGEQTGHLKYLLARNSNSQSQLTKNELEEVRQTLTKNQKGPPNRALTNELMWLQQQYEKVPGSNNPGVSVNQLAAKMGHARAPWTRVAPNNLLTGHYEGN
jgi:hypothetical protein